MTRIGLVLILLAGWTLWAQPPRGFYNWWDSPIAKDLNLSDDQMKQIRAVVRDYRARLIDARAAVEKAEAEMEDAFNDESFSQARASDAIERLVAARSELTRSFSQMSLRLRAVLTNEQWAELQKRRPRQLVGDAIMREMQRRRAGDPKRREERRPPAPPQQQPPPPAQK
ncbi:MAG: periplasmic heavy metal sensor [Bryobacteraceae bacterium]|nr:periplasmic heavy metal sensor [Bryobacteraceae bacterium]